MNTKIDAVQRNQHVVNEDWSRFIGKDIAFQDEVSGTITDETEDAIYIVSQFFTGWMYKAEFFDLLGIED